MKTHSTGHKFNDIFCFWFSPTPHTTPSHLSLHVAIFAYMYIGTLGSCSMPQACARHLSAMYAVCLRHVPDISVLCMQSTSDMCQSSQCHVCSLPKACARHLSVIYAVCLRHVPVISVLCMQLPQACVRYLISYMQPISGMCQTSQCYVCSLPKACARHLSAMYAAYNQACARYLSVTFG